jgi:putative two-component system response regulator
MRILIVDDSEIALALLRNALLASGHTVDTAHDGLEALNCLQQLEHRLVISDWDMPGMDGLELCRAVRQTFAHYIYFVLLTSHNTSDDIVLGMSAGADDFITKPFNPAELALRVRAAERLLSLETRDMAIFAMAKLAETRDSDTGMHLERVRSYAQLLAQQLSKSPKYRQQIDATFVRLIYDTSILHDIGKVGVPDHILLKPDRLTAAEYEEMKTHTTKGRDTLDAALERFPDAMFLRFARDIAGAHHERYDGTGYPDGLAGEEIPLSSRIVALADVYDALTQERVYKPAFDHQHARTHIANESGKHFDPDVVQAFLQVENEFDRIREQMGDVVLAER